MSLSVTVKHTGDIDELGRRYQSLAKLKHKSLPESAEFLWDRGGRASYDMLVTFVGKTGYGKSSTMNRIVNRQIFETSDVSSCTRIAQCADFDLTGERKFYLSLVDLPGLGESASRDREYLELYDSFIRKTTLFVYLLRADQRDYSVDEDAFRQLFPSSEQRQRVIIALNAADKVEPLNRAPSFSPTATQLSNLEAKCKQVAMAFSVSSQRVIPYSAAENWNVGELVDHIAHRLECYWDPSKNTLWLR